MNILEQISHLHKELVGLKPYKKEDEERLWKKFRLEWNYNSNHIEGNTLTYGETELLLIFGKTTGDHELREFEEMQAHDAVVHLVRDYAKDTARELTEADIRDWNKAILVRQFWKEAVTQDGQPTRKLITPGSYKQSPNSVRLANGEIFHYASPEETPILVKELLQWYKEEIRKNELHPVETAALLHYKLVRIHPFDDGNGRTARLLMNYELLRNDFPPVIIKSSDKKNYLFALNKADAGDLSAFVEYIARHVVWSLEISIKAAKGQDIEEIDDIDKEIEVWKRSKTPQRSIVKSPESIVDLARSSLAMLFEEYVARVNEKFNDVFVSIKIQCEFTVAGVKQGSSYLSGNSIGNYVRNNFVSTLATESTFADLSGSEFNRSTDNIILRHFLDGYENGKEILSLRHVLSVDFGPFEYSVAVAGNRIYNKRYSEKITLEERAEIIKTSLKQIFSQLQKHDDKIK